MVVIVITSLALIPFGGIGTKLKKLSCFKDWFSYFS